MAKKDASAPSFEKQLEELQGIVDRLESGEVELEPSLELFERGVALYKQLKGRLSDAEARVEKLVFELDGAAKRVRVDDEDDGEGGATHD